MIKFKPKDVLKLSPCKDGYRDAVKKLGGARAINARGGVTFSDMVAARIPPNDIIWLAVSYAGGADYKRRLRLWAADCAAHVLPIFNKVKMLDDRPAKAIEAARAFARGEIADDTRHAAMIAACDAAKDAVGDAAENAAASAVCAAAKDVVWFAIWAAALHAAKATIYCAYAEDAEEKWQIERLALRMGDNEPEDWSVQIPEQKGTCHE